jgi:hypothetical protein
MLLPGRREIPTLRFTAFGLLLLLTLLFTAFGFLFLLKIQVLASLPLRRKLRFTALGLLLDLILHLFLPRWEPRFTALSFLFFLEIQVLLFLFALQSAGPRLLPALQNWSLPSMRNW